MIWWTLTMLAVLVVMIFCFTKCIQHSFAAGYYTGRLDQLEHKPVDPRAEPRLLSLRMPV